MLMPQSVTRELNKIYISQMNHPRTVSEFISAIQDGQKAAFAEFDLYFKEVEGAYPNVCVPVAGIVDYHIEKSGLKFNFLDMPDYLKNTCIDSPLSVNPASQSLYSPLNRVWMFEQSEHIQWLVDKFVWEISQAAVCKDGVIDGLIWCLNEVMDNVLQHSTINRGFVMGQIHRSSKHIAVCIFDSGQGIYNSLKGTTHAPRYPIDAITLAIKEGITRDKRIGQGNGMWGLHNIVKANSGQIAITSNSAAYTLTGDDVRTFNIPYLSWDRGATIVDFQINFENEIIISEALGGYVPVNFLVENMENSEGNIEYKLSEKSSGTGTRQSGERIRNDIINLCNQSKKVIEVDFSEISVVSSSFADELIGKLLIHFGFSAFNQIIKLKNMNSLIQAIVNRSVSQRIAESLNKN